MNFHPHWPPGAGLAPPAATPASLLEAAGATPVNPPHPWRGSGPSLEGQPRDPLPGGLPGDGPPALLPAGQWLRTPARLARPQDAPTAGAGDDFLLRLYLREALREARLNPDQEIELGWRCSFDDPSARDQLLLGNLRLVMRIAGEYQGLGLPMCDLISEGNLGLVRATGLFDPTQGVPFARYAAIWVRQRMRRALTYQSWPVRMPADFFWQQSRARETEARHDSSSSQGVSTPDVAGRCGFRPATTTPLPHSPFPRFLSLQSQAPGGEDGQELADLLPEERVLSPDEALVRRSDSEFLRGLLVTLKPRESRVLRLRYGLDDGDSRTLEEVGRLLGYVRQGIHRIESAALAKLRRRLAARSG